MSKRPGKLHLNAFLMSVGHHEAAWRLPESDAFASAERYARSTEFVDVSLKLWAPVLPSGLRIFVDQVVPILQQRGLFRLEYGGTALRDNYGLSRPTNPKAQALEAAQ